MLRSFVPKLASVGEIFAPRNAGPVGEETDKKHCGVVLTTRLSHGWLSGGDLSHQVDQP